MAKRSRTQKKPATKKIFLVEDHPTFREGLIQILEKEPDLTVCGTADTVAKALPAIIRLKPDLALVDITLPGKSGLTLIKELRKTRQKIKLLVLSMHDEELYANRVLLAGGDGYIMKHEDPDEIVHAIRDVLAGHVYVSDEVFMNPPKTAGSSSNPATKKAFDLLTDIELEMLALIGRGKKTDAIAREIHIPERKINTHFRQMRGKLNLKTQTDLIRYAVRWVETGAV